MSPDPAPGGSRPPVPGGSWAPDGPPRRSPASLPSARCHWTGSRPERRRAPLCRARYCRGRNTENGLTAHALSALAEELSKRPSVSRRKFEWERRHVLAEVELDEGVRSEWNVGRAHRRAGAIEIGNHSAPCLADLRRAERLLPHGIEVAQRERASCR